MSLMVETPRKGTQQSCATLNNARKCYPDNNPTTEGWKWCQRQRLHFLSAGAKAPYADHENRVALVVKIDRRSRTSQKIRTNVAEDVDEVIYSAEGKLWCQQAAANKKIDQPQTVLVCNKMNWRTNTCSSTDTKMNKK
jgi:hypothetical protein